MDKTFRRAWLFCGGADALHATVMTLVRGGDPGQTWRGVASGPIAAANDWGLGGVVLGIAFHFAIMAVMVAFGLWLARHTRLGQMSPWLAGTFYGLALYAVMYGLVLPMRFGTPFPNPEITKLVTGLIPHVLLVGIPIFWLARRAR